MSASPVNIARYSVLGLGVAYGFLHQRTLNKQAKEHKAKSAYAHKEQLIAQAKAKFLEKTNPTKGNGVITNPDDPKFDLEKFLLNIEKEDASKKAHA